MDIAKAFETAFKRKREKGWEKIYVMVDIHDTIIRACYEREETFDYFPGAREALRALTGREDICLILWTACDRDKLSAYRSRFERDGIVFDYANENPEVANTELSCFDNKLYFNVGIDDKFGFDGQTDWQRVIDAIGVAGGLVGLSHTSRLCVGEGDTAATLGSGDLPVLATPAMLALMENAAMLAVAGHLPEGQTTVGGHIEASHLRPTPTGGEVTATATVTRVEGKRVEFAVTAHCGDTLLGQGTHLRFIVDRDAFMSRL